VPPLRVKDVDFAYRQILVRDGKGDKDRVTMLPEKLAGPLRGHLAPCARCMRGTSTKASARSSCRLRSRESIRAPEDWAWQYIFPSTRRRSTRATAWCAGIT
jgi:integrase